MVTGQKRNRVAMSYLKRQTLKLVLNRFKTSAEGWRSGESDNDAVQSHYGSAKELLERTENDQRRRNDLKVGGPVLEKVDDQLW